MYMVVHATSVSPEPLFGLLTHHRQIGTQDTLITIPGFISMAGKHATAVT